MNGAVIIPTIKFLLNKAAENLYAGSTVQFHAGALDRQEIGDSSATDGFNGSLSTRMLKSVGITPQPCSIQFIARMGRRT